MKICTKALADAAVVTQDPQCAWADGYAEMTRWADAQPVEDATGGGTLALVQKQLRSVGAPLWSAFDVWAKAHPDSNALRVMNCCSDGGPDQKRCRRELRCICYPLPRVLF